MHQQAPGLQPLALAPLPLGQIRPQGWLRAQLRIQADGLSGHLDEFWPDVAASGWIGGSAEGWERGPYWLDGVVPLAWLLDDARLQAKVQRWADYILQHQHPDGWLGPVADRVHGYPYDPWPVFIVLKALRQYYEVSADARVPQALERFFGRLQDLLAEQPLKSWGMYRWADLVLSVFWLYEQTGAPWLLDLAALAHEQGFDWADHFRNFKDTGKTPPERCDLSTHGVNIAMGLKSAAVWSRRSGDAGDRAAAAQMLATLDRYHGQINGLYTCDEHLAGLNPSQGTELCTVVEAMFSLETLLAILGDPAHADRLERIAYNALPATFKPDMWAHQYDQQANQVLCRVAEDRLYTDNGPDANIFGLAPHFGCCTANMHQGWPKLAASLWMSTPDGGLAAVAYAPSTVNTTIGGQPIEVTLDTGYPFDDTLIFTVHTSAALTFPLYLRIPAWADGATVQVGDDPAGATTAGGFHRIDREWRDGARVVLRLPMTPRVVERYHGSVAIERGPLVYSLALGEDWRLVAGEPPHGDWEVYPTGAWNYGLVLDRDQPENSLKFETGTPGATPFSPDGAAARATVKGRRVAEWRLEHNAAGELPFSPINSAAPLEELTLLPYGCTNLRVTEFPLLEK